MKILIVMDPGIKIPVKGYGGHERLVEMFAKEYHRLGYEVHLLITSGSSVEGCTVHDFGKEGFPPQKKDARKAVLTAWKFLRKNRLNFDVVHNFGRLAYLLPILHSPVKKIMTYGREITSHNIQLINWIGGKNMVFTACSKNLMSRVKASGNWEVVYNAIVFNNYELEEKTEEDAPLIFLGRIEKIKGCHTAIKVAKATGNKLIIAGNVSPLPEEKEYYEKEIAPHIDGEQIKYVGTVNDQQKNEWLGKSKALLFPIEWNEPFGIVMIEAMACGTPVIAFNRGSVNEVIDEGVTGKKVNTVREMIEAVHGVEELSRIKCRQQAKQRFDVEIIAKKYLSIIDENRLRVVILTTHQPAANPRALKEYDSLKALGYSIKFLYAYNADWSYQIDEKKFSAGDLARQDFLEVAGNPHSQPIRYLISRILYRLFRALAPVIPFCRSMSTSRAALGLWKAINSYRADLYIGHYLGALPAAVRASNMFGAKVIFDAEDFHRGEQLYYSAQLKNVVYTEGRYLPLVNAITTASSMISKEYQDLFPGKDILTVNNTFSVKYLQPLTVKKEEILKLFWFSQNIGTYRGLEIMIKALNELANMKISLTIMGNRRSPEYEHILLNLAEEPGRIIFKDPVSPEEIFRIAAGHDIGFAGEVPNCYNKEICLSNKIFAYLLGGNCILASDMPGQREFLEQNPGIGFIYKYNDPSDLAMKIKSLYINRTLLENCKSSSRVLARNTMNWELEQGSWIKLVNSLLGNEDEIDSGRIAHLHLVNK